MIRRWRAFEAILGPQKRIERRRGGEVPHRRGRRRSRQPEPMQKAAALVALSPADRERLAAMLKGDNA